MTRYAQHRPYAAPESLDDLTGPAHGMLELPAHLAWTGRRRYDLDDPADLAVLYERIIVEAATPRDLCLLSAITLRAVWPRLYLPSPARSLWQTRFPDLAAAA
jgi:hypothetical protein